MAITLLKSNDITFCFDFCAVFWHKTSLSKNSYNQLILQVIICTSRLERWFLLSGVDFELEQRIARANRTYYSLLHHDILFDVMKYVTRITLFQVISAIRALVLE